MSSMGDHYVVSGARMFGQQHIHACYRIISTSTRTGLCSVQVLSVMVLAKRVDKRLVVQWGQQLAFSLISAVIRIRQAQRQCAGEVIEEHQPQ